MRNLFAQSAPMHDDKSRYPLPTHPEFAPPSMFFTITVLPFTLNISPPTTTKKSALICWVGRYQAKVTEGPESARNLLEEHTRIRRELAKQKVDVVEEQLKEEEEILRSIRAAKALQSVNELAKGIKYTESIKTGWRAPRFVLDRPAKVTDQLREEYNIEIEGENCPPLCRRFNEFKLHPAILDQLTRKNIVNPTPIQMQALPVIMSGRDMIGVAFTGSGKTMAFSLPVPLKKYFDRRVSTKWFRSTSPDSALHADANGCSPLVSRSMGK